jgi:hypothetical protein
MGFPSVRRWQGRLTLTIGLTRDAGLTLGFLGFRAIGDRERATGTAAWSADGLARPKAGLSSRPGR